MMIAIPGGRALALLTYPGVVVHQLASQLCCRLFRVPIEKVVYFNTGSPLAYVQYEEPATATQAVCIALGPFFINSLVGALIAFPSALQWQLHAMNLLDWVLLYLGVSIAMHAFPGWHTAQALWASVVKRPGASRISKVLVTPLVAVLYAGAAASIWGLEIAYGVGICAGLPWLAVMWYA